MADSTLTTRRDKGFTVAEIIVASAILLFTATATISGVMFAAESAQMSQRRTEALNLANGQLELARNLSFDDVATVEPSNGLPAGKVPGSQTIGEYTVTIDIAYGTYGASTAARYKTISVEASWGLPVPGSVVVSSMIAGASGIQDYNFGSVSLTVQDEGSPAKGASGVIVWLTDANSHTYSVMTTDSGVAQFTYIPSGNISFSSIKAGYTVDAPTAPTCVANATTNYGPVTAHAARTGTIRCLSPAGDPVAGVTVDLSAGPNTVTSVQSDANGNATFSSALMKGTYKVGITHASYQVPTAQVLTVGSTDVSLSVTLAVKPSTVTATANSKGTIYVWSADGTLIDSTGTASKKPYSATFILTNPDIEPTVYYFTTKNTFATTTIATVSPGQTYSIAVK
jgi:hypothetical protein